MSDTNYFASVVKILEKPVERIINDKIVTTEFRAQLTQVRNTRIVNLVFWGNLARDVVNYYHINDYIMIEGYLLLHNKFSDKLNQQKLKRVSITVNKLYFLKPKRS
jgi:single-stranded DNA-binding protein